MRLKNALLIFLFIFPLAVFPQSKPVIKNLVFEGGGIRGIAYCGVITEMESHNMVQYIEKVGGTSAGAIMALTVALGYTGNEIRQIIGHTNFRKFNDGRYLFIGGIHRTNKYFGWYRGRRFENWLENLIESKTGNSGITFGELKQKGFKDLYITGTCLNQQKLVIFSHETYPRMRVKDAVRISMSVPLYFEAVFIDKDGKVITRPRQKDGLDVMVDGGLIGNFPIRMFDSAGQANHATLGIRLDSDEQIRNDREGKSIAALPVENFNQYITAIYNMVIENLNRMPLTSQDWARTVSVSDGKIGPRIRKLSDDEINTLIGNGGKAMRSYLAECPGQ